MAQLDSRVLLALDKAKAIDTSSIRNQLNLNRNRDDQQAQLDIQNARNAELDAQNKTAQDLRNENLQSQISGRKDAADRNLVIQGRQDEAFDVQKFDTQLDDNLAQVKTFINNGKIAEAKDLMAKTSTFVSESAINEDKRTAELQGVNSILLDLNTNQGKNALGLIDGALNQGTGASTVKKTDVANLTLKDNTKIKQVTNTNTDGTVDVSYINNKGQKIDVTEEQVNNSLNEKEREIKAQLDKETATDKLENAAKVKLAENLAKVEKDSIGAIELEKSLSKDRAAKTKEDIATGVSAADGLVGIREAQELLKTVSTGGVDKLAFWAKSKFGIESQDEGVLNNIFEQSIIKQIKPIFGGAPSKDEVFLLRDIEANFGKSPETNKKLMERLEEAVTLRALRGVRQASKHKYSEQVFQISSSLGITEQEATDIANIQNQDKRLTAFYKAKANSAVQNNQNGVQLTEEEQNAALDKKYDLGEP